MTQLYVLFEHASGFSLFRVKEFEEVGAFLPQVEEASSVAAKFQQVVQLVGFKPFTNAVNSLQNMNAVTEGILTDDLQAFLETNLPKTTKKGQIQLGVADPKLGAAINEALDMSITHIGVVPEILRGIRTHICQFIKGLSPATLKQTELGLGHSYSRGKVKFNVNRVDNMIIQSIALVDQLDKDINTFAMRIREWYSYHFPELYKVVSDNHQYALCADFIKDRHSLSEASLEGLEQITMDSAKAQAVLDASRMSMGMDISAIDLMNIERFAKRLIGLAEYRKKLATYLRSKMSAVAPNLSALIGEVVGARLISHAGSLTNLAKYPASTVQILGAEKALFRALKTKGNTPKYGLIFHSTFIGRAGSANKGRISRYLANKCSIASRIDCFTEVPTSVFGEKLKDQVEERLKFYETGDVPRKNVEVMSEALVEHNERVAAIASKNKKKKKKRKHENAADEEETPAVNGEAEGEPPKKKKKKKHQEGEEAPVNGEAVVEADDTPKKKKKKKQAEEAPAEPEPEQTEDVVVKKKKKKKNKDAVEEPAAPMEVEAEATEDTPKKKKKKKKAQEAE
ncbi:unnamed protein product [Meganyctiphanes norvegica]|uniref:Nucleolar protein 56 n=1 Tax=Meganyctiphanes norvegica TaxID=48144 RepID=A0AAV2RV53_MEGNR